VGDPMKSARWQRERAAYLALCKAQGLPCAICGQPIDYDLPGTHRGGPHVDHTQARALGGSVWDRSNWRPAHMICNTRRGAALGGAVTKLRKVTAVRYSPSRNW
jgi:5-methylcytosine-specific restriction endonuclease McrA